MIRSMRAAALSLAAIASIGLAVTLAGCNGGKEDKVEPVVNVQTVPVKKEAISQVVTSDAVITPVEQAAISPKITAPVKRFLVARGAHVKKGELLAVLENRDLAASALDSQGQYAQAQATYENTTAATLPEEMQKAQSDTDTARKAYDAEQKLFDSRQDLFNQGALPRKDLDQAAVSLVQARSQYELAAKHLESLKQVGHTQELKAAGGQLQSAQGKYLGAEAQLGYSQIRSPIDGVVTERPQYAGEIAQAGTPLITVVNSKRIVARAHIPQSQAIFLKVGDAAIVTVPGLAEPVPGKVTLVNAATDANSTTIEVWVEAANPNSTIKPGFTGTITATARTVEDALVIPAAALQPGEDGGFTVLVAGSDNHAHQRKAQVGIRNGNDVQIIDGVKEGEQVIAVGGYGLADGTAIKIQPAEKPAEDEHAGDEQKPSAASTSASKE